MLLATVTDDYRPRVQKIHRLSLRLAREVQRQKHLTQKADGDVHPIMQPITVGSVFDDMEAAFGSHR